MKRIKICFVDFFPGFNEKDNDFIDILNIKYKVIIDKKNPDVIFYSCFGNEHVYYDCIRIFYTGECVTPDFNICDYAIGFDRIEMGDRYIRVPLYRLFQYKRNYEKLFNRPKVLGIDKSKEFCNFVVSNCFADDIRLKVYEALSTYKKINSGGRFRNNVGGPVSDKYEFQRKHKFSIAFENCVYDGYATEKLVDALAAGTVPIYLGDTNIHLDFNEESFINGHRYSSIEEMIEKVKEIDSNDEQYLKMINTNPIISDKRNNDDLRDFLFHIFEQNITTAKRRPSSRYAKEYTESLKRYHFLEKNIFSKITRIKKLIYRVTHNAI